MIVVAGEALVDLVLDDSAEVRAHPGGGPFNVSRTIARLEQPVCYLGRISSDRLGSLLLRTLEEDGVRLDSVVATHEPTTLALAELDGRGGASYRFYAEGTSAAGLTTEEAGSALPPQVDMLHLGTLGLMLEPTATALESVLSVLSPDALVALDPNCRPWAIRDPDGYRQRLARVLARSDVVKVSDQDLAWLQPESSPDETARSLLHQGPRLVLHTHGADGVTVIAPEGVTTIPVPPARVVDTIGAGDAFGGGFLAWWHRQGLGRDDLDDREATLEATRFACRVAVWTCEHAGADPPRAADLAG
jgi:fructokinase